MGHCARVILAAVILSVACTKPDGPHELVVTVSGALGNESMRSEDVVATLVSRTVCENTIAKMMKGPGPQGGEAVSRTANSRTDKVGPYNMTSSFRCRLNMAAKPQPVVETTGTPSPAAAPEPVATQPASTPPAEQPAVTSPATVETDEAAERVYRELQKMERQRAGR